MRSAILLAALVVTASFLPRTASAFEANNAGAPAGTASFADPDVTLGLEGSDGDSAAEGPRAAGPMSGSLQVYGDVKSQSESGSAPIPGRLP